MNYYFFLDKHKDFNSSVNLFNIPSCEHLSKDYSKDRFIIAVYSDGNSWNYFNLGKFKSKTNIELDKNQLPEKFRNESVYIFFSEDLNFDSTNLKIKPRYMQSMPEWRSNIKIYNEFTATSYQGEIPDVLLNKDLSIVSCSPMIQNKNNINNYLYIVNLRKKPDKIKYEIEILDTKKNVIGKHFAFTNTVNLIDLNKFVNNLDENVFIIRSLYYGGLPIYFSHNNEKSQLSLEHTHPPSSYLIFGNNMEFQKRKKTFWFN